MVFNLTSAAEKPPKPSLGSRVLNGARKAMAAIMSIPSLRGVGMMVLQGLRAATVITLLTACTACWVLIIKIDKTKPYFVFECASLFFTSAFTSLLIISELAFADSIKSYLRRTWPLLSDHHGLSWLGAGMLIIGCRILGSFNRSVNHMGSAFSSLVLAAGILSFVFGSLNIIGSLIWCDRTENINSRDIREQGSLARSRRDYDDTGSSVRNEKTKSKFMAMFWNTNTSDKKRSGFGMFGRGRAKRDIEGQMNDQASPIRRPDSAMHPANRSSSRYSDANRDCF